MKDFIPLYVKLEAIRPILVSKPNFEYNHVLSLLRLAVGCIFNLQVADKEFKQIGNFFVFRSASFAAFDILTSYKYPQNSKNKNKTSYNNTWPEKNCDLLKNY